MFNATPFQHLHFQTVAGVVFSIHWSFLETSSPSLSNKLCHQFHFFQGLHSKMLKTWNQTFWFSLWRRGFLWTIDLHVPETFPSENWTFSVPNVDEWVETAQASLPARPSKWTVSRSTLAPSCPFAKGMQDHRPLEFQLVWKLAGCWQAFRSLFSNEPATMKFTEYQLKLGFSEFFSNKKNSLILNVNENKNKWLFEFRLKVASTLLNWEKMCICLFWVQLQIAKKGWSNNLLKPSFTVVFGISSLCRVELEIATQVESVAFAPN